MTKKTVQRCGTHHGYFDHKRNGSPACTVCLAAYAKWMREYRHRTGRNTHTLTPDTILQRHGIKVEP